MCNLKFKVTKIQTDKKLKTRYDKDTDTIITLSLKNTLPISKK